MRWIALILFCFLATPVYAGDEYVVGHYWAHIGPEDLRTSKGVRLYSAANILRQDRANVHRFGIIHKGDQKDNWFFQPEARAAMPEMFEARGGIPPWMEKFIRRGNINVYVTIYAIDGNFTSLKVDIPG